MIVLLTDFSNSDPYIGQMENAIAKVAPDVRVINLFSSLPDFNVKGSAYLLPAWCKEFSADSIFVAVVDPGVGGDRRPLMVRIDNQWWVGPDNGLFSVLCKRAATVEAYEIHWRPEKLSMTFHGRDLFAPVAAMLAAGKVVDSSLIDSHSLIREDWPEDLWEVVYIDHYGNLITGVRASTVESAAILKTANHVISAAASKFSDVAVGELFWYENSNGLLEIAANQCSACELIGASVGDSIYCNQSDVTR